MIRNWFAFTSLKNVIAGIMAILFAFMTYEISIADEFQLDSRIAAIKCENSRPVLPNVLKKQLREIALGDLPSEQEVPAHAEKVTQLSYLVSLFVEFCNGDAALSLAMSCLDDLASANIPDACLLSVVSYAQFGHQGLGSDLKIDYFDEGFSVFPPISMLYYKTWLSPCALPQLAPPENQTDKDILNRMGLNPFSFSPNQGFMQPVTDNYFSDFSECISNIREATEDGSPNAIYAIFRDELSKIRNNFVNYMNVRIDYTCHKRPSICENE